MCDLRSRLNELIIMFILIRVHSMRVFACHSPVLREVKSKEIIRCQLDGFLRSDEG